MFARPASIYVLTLVVGHFTLFSPHNLAPEYPARRYTFAFSCYGTFGFFLFTFALCMSSANCFCLGWLSGVAFVLTHHSTSYSLPCYDFAAIAIVLPIITATLCRRWSRFILIILVSVPVVTKPRINFTTRIVYKVQIPSVIVNCLQLRGDVRLLLLAIFFTSYCGLLPLSSQRTTWQSKNSGNHRDRDGREYPGIHMPRAPWEVSPLPLLTIFAHASNRRGHNRSDLLLFIFFSFSSGDKMDGMVEKGVVRFQNEFFFLVRNSFVKALVGRRRGRVRCGGALLELRANRVDKRPNQQKRSRGSFLALLLTVRREYQLHFV